MVCENTFYNKKSEKFQLFNETHKMTLMQTSEIIQIRTCAKAKR